MSATGYRLRTIGWVLAIAVAGCGGSGGGGGGGAATPGAAGVVSSGIGAGAPGAFTVSAVNPAPGATSVPHQLPVRAVFGNAAVDASTVDGQSFFITRAGAQAHVAGRITIPSALE